MLPGPVSTRFIGQRVARAGGRAVPDRPRPLRRRHHRCPARLHVAFVRSDVARGRIVVDRHRRGARDARGGGRVRRGGPQPPRPRPQGRRRAARPRAARSGCSPTATSDASVSRSPWSSPTPATTPRTPSTRSWSTSTRCRPGRRPARRARRRRPARAPGHGLEPLRRLPAVRATRSSTTVFASAPVVRDRDLPAAPLRDGADGDPRDPRQLGAVAARSSPSGSRRRARTACALRWRASLGHRRQPGPRRSCPTSAARSG